MPKDNFDQLMDRWVDQEAKSAPELRPTADMYRMIEARKKRFPFLFPFPRRAIAGVAMACLILAAIFYLAIYRPPFLFGSSPESVSSFIQQRQWVTSKDEISFLEPEKLGKGPRGGLNCIQMLRFQYYRPGSRFVAAIDLLSPGSEPLSLTSEDNYRLTIAPAEVCHLYIFQMNTAKTLSRLFPDAPYSSQQNPLLPGEITILPSEPNWFYLQGDRGEQYLYIILSLRPLPDLENLYTQTIQADGDSQKQEALTGLLKYIDTLTAAHPAEVQKVTFTFWYR